MKIEGYLAARTPKRSGCWYEQLRMKGCVRSTGRAPWWTKCLVLFNIALMAILGTPGWPTSPSNTLSVTVQRFLGMSCFFKGEDSLFFQTLFIRIISDLQKMFSSVLSRVRLFATPWTTARQASLSITNCQSLLQLKSIESVMPPNHLNLCHPLLLLSSIFPSIKVFSNESVLHIRWLKFWSFSFNINPSNEYSGLISFRMDWLDLLAVQETLKSLLHHHSSKASVLLCSAFFIAQLSYQLPW